MNDNSIKAGISCQLGVLAKGTHAAAALGECYGCDEDDNNHRYRLRETCMANPLRKRINQPVVLPHVNYGRISGCGVGVRGALV